MSKQNYPYGAPLWLHINLLLDTIDTTGNVVTTTDRLSSFSNIPEKLIKPTLDKLVKYKLIKLKKLNTQYFLITLNYLEE